MSRINGQFLDTTLRRDDSVSPPSDRRRQDELMLGDGPLHSLPLALLRGREAVMSHYRDKLRELDLTEQQWRVLRTLDISGELELTELARRAYLLPASLSRIIQALQDRGLICRQPVPGDRRRVVVTLEQDGRNLIKAGLPDFESLHAGIARAFGAGNLADLQRLLALLERAMAEKGVSGA